MHCDSAGRWPPHPPLCPGRQHRAPWQAGLVLALLAITVWRIWVVVHVNAGLYVDEAQYWVWSRSLDWGYYSKPPMIAALVALSTLLFGDGLLGVKALAMLCYPLTAWVLYRWVGEVVGESVAGVPASVKPGRAGLVAALAFIASPVAGLLGLAATTDAPLLLAWSLASRALWRAGRHGRPADWLALGWWLGLGLMSKYTMAAFALSALGWLWTLPAQAGAPRSWTRRRGLLAAAAVAALCVAPNLAWNAAHGWPTWRHTAEITLGAAATPWQDTLGAYLAGLAMLLGPVTVPWALVWAVRAPQPAPWPARGDEPARASGPSRSARAEAWRLAAWLVAPLAAIGVAQAWHAKAQVNWVAPVLVGAVLALALWLRAEQPGRRLHGWYLALAAQTMLLAGVTLAGDLAEAVHRPLPRQLDVWARMRGWDEAFEQLRPAAEAYWRSQGEPAARPVLGGDRAVLANGAYAWRHLAPQWVAWREAGALPHDHFQLLSPLQPGDRRQPLLIVSEGPPDAAWQAALGGPPQRLAVAEVEQSPGHRLHLELWQAELAPAPSLAQAARDARQGQ